MVSTGAILFLSQTIPTSLSLRHLLFNLFRYINQAKSVEYPINVGHTPDIPQRLGSVHYLSDFTDIVIHQQHGTPSKALAALSVVDPQLLGEFISPALFQRIAFVSFASNNKFSNSSRIAFNLFGFIT